MSAEGRVLLIAAAIIGGLLFLEMVIMSLSSPPPSPLSPPWRTRTLALADSQCRKDLVEQLDATATPPSRAG
jgi:hypothetical protein